MFLWVFVMHISVRMTFHFWFSSCTSLYEWLSILLWVFVMHISVRMTIHILIGFCHAHLCTNDYPFIIEFCHVHLCTNDFPYSYKFLSCTCLYEWLSIFFWVFVMHISVQMTIRTLLDFCHSHICTNDSPFFKCLFVFHIFLRMIIHFLFSSSTSFYEWLSILLLVFFMHIFVRMTIFSPNYFQCVTVNRE